MKSHSIVLVIAGVAAGIALTLACSDSPHGADAATCECPAAELPLAGRIVNVESPATLAPNSDGGAGALCPDGAIRLTGSCTAGGSVPNIVLQQSGYDIPADQNWTCNWHNNLGISVAVKAVVTCLKPTP
jgi:hypothetical protein